MGQLNPNHMIKTTILLSLILLISSCAAGIKPITKKELSSSNTTVYQSIQKDSKLNIKIPPETNVFNINLLEMQKTNKSSTLKLTVVSPAKNINIDTQPPIARISTSFLIFWYGTIIIALLTFLYIKRRKTPNTIKKNKKLIK